MVSLELTTGTEEGGGGQIEQRTRTEQRTRCRQSREPERKEAGKAEGRNEEGGTQRATGNLIWN